MKSGLAPQQRPQEVVQSPAAVQTIAVEATRRLQLPHLKT